MYQLLEFQQDDNKDYIVNKGTIKMYIGNKGGRRPAAPLICQEAATEVALGRAAKKTVDPASKEHGAAVNALTVMVVAAATNNAFPRGWICPCGSCCLR